MLVRCFTEDALSRDKFGMLVPDVAGSAKEAVPSGSAQDEELESLFRIRSFTVFVDGMKDLSRRAISGTPLRLTGFDQLFPLVPAVASNGDASRTTAMPKQVSKLLTDASAPLSQEERTVGHAAASRHRWMIPPFDKTWWNVVQVRSAEKVVLAAWSFNIKCKRVPPFGVSTILIRIRGRMCKQRLLLRR